MFTSVVGTPIDPRNCTRMVQNACKAAGVRVVRLHDFRHGCVSILLELGVPPRTAMEIVGHTTLELTMNTYGHVNLAAKREAMEAVGDLFDVPGESKCRSESEVTVMQPDSESLRSRTLDTQNRRSDVVCLRLQTCAPGEIRTPNLLIRSQMLYPLSYRRRSSVWLRTAQL